METPTEVQSVKTETPTEVKTETKPDFNQRLDNFLQTNKPKEPVGEVDFDFNDIEKIQDPQAKEYVEKAYKSLRKGFDKKYQEVAEIAKNLKGQSVWTPERLKAEMNKPDFVQSAQTITSSVQQPSSNPRDSGLTDEEWSVLSDKEKGQLVNMQARINSLEQLATSNMWRQQDADLKQKYPNYDAQAIDTLTADLISGKVQANREHLFKVMDYDGLQKRMEEKIKAAYQMGREDERSGITERVNVSTIEGTTVQPNKAIEPIKGEKPIDFFKRAATQRLAERKSSSAQTRT